MKKIIIAFAICFSFNFNISAQEVFRIKNVATNTYLLLNNGNLTVSQDDDESAAAIWHFLIRENGEYRFKNHEDGSYLNIENEQLQSSSIEHHWWSPLWAVENVPGTNYIRIRSIWKATRYLNMQNGLACTDIQSDWQSALWEKEAVDPSLVYDPNANILNAQKALDAHNILRAEVGVPALEWSEDLAFKAQLWADKVARKNGGMRIVLEHGDSGENIASGFVTGDPPETRIFNGWGENEKPNFNPATRKCYEGKVCGHYTQIVWRKTTKVGCGVGVNKNGEYILVCNYDPKGNFNREAAF
ncbi:CAP domain-containing protein [Ulvibacter antarcticus]|uniref:Ricin-type beta-trefoil lectin protein n=1 Tax=Ulvibacter antarcticus TaxID=442714 RepID=A0A3L9YES8_9FLAO|nr:CAP domain-containing protein [Ulvibacter antarcticus]RMA58894.1 ricin-type beta-trefoil lectin protein [Ulvibacter antarcticus]